MVRSPYALSRTTQVLTPEEPKPRVVKTKKTRRSRARQSEDDCMEESNSVADEEFSTGRIEYEHWEDGEITDRSDCRAACRIGTETVAAFGDAVSEVFDLINEVAFPRVIDIATEEGLVRDGASYDEDDDSIFNRSKSYDRGKKAKEFLDFIGAVRPRNSKIVTTPLPPPDLLSPSGTLLDLQSKRKTTVTVEPMWEQDSRDDEDSSNDDCRNTEQTRQKIRDQRFQEPLEKQSDRYSSHIHSDSSDDWSDRKSQGKGEDDYKDYIEDVLYNKQKRERTSTISSQFRPVQSLSSIAQSKNAIHRSKQVKEQTELLTIVESSQEDDEEDDDKNPHKLLRDLVKKEEQVNDNDLEDIEKTDGVDEDDYYSSAVSESCYSSYEEHGDDSFVDDSTASSEDSHDSLLEESVCDEDESVTNHTRSSIRIKHSLLDGDDAEDEMSAMRRTISIESDEISFDEEDDESVIRDGQAAGSVEEAESSTPPTSSVAEILLQEEDSVEDTSKFCSSYDQLYPADSLFSFITYDEKDTLFDFAEAPVETGDVRLLTITVPDLSLTEENIENRMIANFGEATAETDDVRPLTITVPGLSLAEENIEDIMIANDELIDDQEDDQDKQEQVQDEQIQEGEQKEEQEDDQDEQEPGQDEQELGQDERELGQDEQDLGQDERELEQEDLENHRNDKENNIKIATQRYDPSERREGVEENIEEDEKEKVEEQVSRVSKTFLSVLYGKKSEIQAFNYVSVSEHRRQWPPRRSAAFPRYDYSSLTQTKNEAGNGREESPTRDEPSSSSHSSVVSVSTSGSNQVDTRRQWPPRGSPALPRYDYSSLTHTKNEAGNGREESPTRDEPSSSSHSSVVSVSSSGSSQVDAHVQKAKFNNNNNKMSNVKLITKTFDHQTMKRHAMARLKIYNRRKTRVIELQQNVE